MLHVLSSCFSIEKVRLAKEQYLDLYIWGQEKVFKEESCKE